MRALNGIASSGERTQQLSNRAPQSALRPRSGRPEPGRGAGTLLAVGRFPDLSIRLARSRAC